MSESPFASGFAAAVFGHDPRACPFDKLTKEWAEWQRGHGLGCDYILALKERELKLQPKGVRNES